MVSVPDKLASQVVGNVGMYLVCYTLSRLGWNVMPTSRNTRGIDVLAYNHDATLTLALQVKSLSKRAPVPLGNALDRIMGDYWIIVNQAVSDAPNCFILTPDEVRQAAHRGEKDNRVSYWLQPKAYEQAQFKDRWQRLGSPLPQGLG